MKFPFISASYAPTSNVINGQECINYYPEMETPESKNTKAMIMTPGLTLFATVTEGTVNRGMFTTANGRMFGVFSTKFVEFVAAGTYTVRGTLNTSSGRVNFAENSRNLANTTGGSIGLVDGTDGWVFVLSDNSFTQITDGGFPSGTTDIVSIDGFFIVNEGSTGRVFYSTVHDGLTWDGSNFATAEGSPDNIQSMISVRNKLWIAGSDTTEVFYNTSDSNNQFLRYPGALNNKGCYAPNSLAQINGHAFWLGSSEEGNNIVFMSEGYESVRISDHALEDKISEYAQTDDAIGFTYTQRGHTFYWLNFQTGDASWLFDLNTRVWHRRAYLNKGILERHRAQYKTSFNNKTYVGDRSSSKVYELDFDVYTDNGSPIRRQMQTPPIHDDRKDLFIDKLEIDMDRGTGTTTGQGVKPVAMIEKSKDGGKTWGNEVFVPIGEKGKYANRIQRRRLGTGKDIRFRVSISDPIKCNLVAGHLEGNTE